MTSSYRMIIRPPFRLEVTSGNQDGLALSSRVQHVSMNLKITLDLNSVSRGRPHDTGCPHHHKRPHLETRLYLSPCSQYARISWIFAPFLSFSYDVYVTDWVQVTLHHLSYIVYEKESSSHGVCLCVEGGGGKGDEREGGYHYRTQLTYWRYLPSEHLLHKYREGAYIFDEA